jgi:hypothetical protein
MPYLFKNALSLNLLESEFLDLAIIWDFGLRHKEVNTDETHRRSRMSHASNFTQLIVITRIDNITQYYTSNNHCITKHGTTPSID